jgi:multiple sugar transport system ATP-binding protein
MIELRGVTKRFGTTLALRNLSFECQERQFVVVFGPAGAGKSTTLRLIAGIAEPNYGDIWFRGNSLKGVPPERRGFSMVFENYALYSHLTVFENLAFPLRARRLPESEIRKRVNEMAEVLQMSATLDRKPGFLSGGQRQRVALGRGLIRDADLYLLDEPISHLDARLRIQMRAELKNICLQKQSTVIHVTHDYREAMALADSVVVLNKGILMQHGTPEEVYHNPANDFVARFVGDPPMSFVAAGFAVQDGRRVFRIGDRGWILAAPDDFDVSKNAIAAKCNDLRLGFRANQISLASSMDPVHNVPVSVYLAEMQGHRNLITVKLDQDLIQVVTAPDERWKVGERAWMSMVPDAMHVFADGQAIHHPELKLEFSANPITGGLSEI